MRVRHSKLLALIGAGILAVTTLVACGNGDATANTASSAEASTVAASSEVASTETTADLSGSISMVGSTSMEKFANALSEAFMEEYPDVTVTAEFVGSGAGIEAVTNGTADIGNSSRSLKDEEKAAGVAENIVAIDGIAVCVDPANEVADLTKEQLTNIYNGTVTNWKEVGGEDLKIQVINRDEASGTREAFRTIVMGGTPFDRRSAVLSGTGQVRDVVSRSRGAIGYISLGFVESLNAKTSVKAVSVNHVEASEKTVASGGYPISRDLYFFVKGTPSQQAQDYIDYVTSEKMDKQIREAGFIPVTNDEKGSE